MISGTLTQTNQSKTIRNYHFFLNHREPIQNGILTTFLLIFIFTDILIIFNLKNNHI